MEVQQNKAHTKGSSTPNTRQRRQESADHGEAGKEWGCGNLHTVRHTQADWNYLAEWWTGLCGVADYWQWEQVSLHCRHWRHHKRESGRRAQEAKTTKKTQTEKITTKPRPWHMQPTIFLLTRQPSINLFTSGSIFDSLSETPTHTHANTHTHTNSQSERARERHRRTELSIKALYVFVSFCI